MTCYLLWNWAAFDLPQKLACMLAVAVPLHVFEENTFPGGFFYMNNMGFGSKEPMVYPQNRCTNMITNLGAEIVIIAVAAQRCDDRTGCHEPGGLLRAGGDRESHA